jgi:L-glutamine:2-deoxy-scyllo-inosose/3-amino-2,3-dideoxy-scyllo-inosose aminotransferase
MTQMRTAAHQLALLGGQPAAASVEPPAWPPRSQAVRDALSDLYMSGHWSFNLGGLERRFANAFAARHNTRHGVFMMNGTVTLQCALAAFGIGPGDEVIVPAHTWLATVMAVAYIGATPVVVDVAADTLCLDTDEANDAVTERTRAIIPVHMLGSMADIDAVSALATNHDLVVIEDCAQAHGGVWAGRSVGSWGHVGSFSFQQNKLMTSGEGGICITDDEMIAERIYRQKAIGYRPDDPMGEWSPAHDDGLVCHNFRALEFAPLILLDQLDRLTNQALRYEASASYLRQQIDRIDGVRMQARGRRADVQPYYKVGLVFDGDRFAGIPQARIIDALAAEGVPVRAGYGAAHHHALFNLPGTRYRVHGSGTPVAEHVAGAQTVTLAHEYLGCSQSELDCIAAAIDKVATLVPDIT